MQSQDSCQRFIFEEADIRGEIVRLDGSYVDTISNHDYPPAVSKLLGEFLTATALMSATIKYEGRLVLQARGEGELRLLMAECTSDGHVRGIARYERPPTAETFDMLLGDGTLAITVDTLRSEPYQGIVSLQPQGLAASLQAYFEQSEQLGTRFYFAVNEERACGMMLQQLPSKTGGDPDQREQQWEHVLHLAQTLTAEEMLTLDNQEMLYRLYHQDQVTVFPPAALEYRCSCSRERTAAALVSIGREEVSSIIAEQGEVKIACEFCGSEYRFDAAEVALLLDDGGETLH